MIALANILIDGVMLGALYALFAAGLSLIFGVMRLVNLAHGDLIVVAAYLILVIASQFGLNVFLALALAAPLMFAFGYVLQVGLLNRVLGGDVLPPLLVTFGLSIILQNGALALFTADSRRLPTAGLESASLAFGPFAVGLMPLMTLAAAVLVIFALNRLFFGAAIGRAFRAVSDDADTAELMGVDNRKLYALAFSIAMIFTAIAGTLFAIRTNFDPAAGPIRLILAFEAVIIGGLGSLWGTLIGGMVLGIAQSVGAALSPTWQILAGHIAFLIILVVRPSGLFPRTRD